MAEACGGSPQGITNLASMPRQPHLARAFSGMLVILLLLLFPFLPLLLHSCQTEQSG